MEDQGLGGCVGEKNALRPSHGVGEDSSMSSAAGAGVGQKLKPGHGGAKGPPSPHFALKMGTQGPLSFHPPFSGVVGSNAQPWQQQHSSIAGTWQGHMVLAKLQPSRICGEVGAGAVRRSEPEQSLSLRVLGLVELRLCRTDPAPRSCLQSCAMLDVPSPGAQGSRGASSLMTPLSLSLEGISMLCNAA